MRALKFTAALILAAASLVGAQALATAPSATNYKNIIQGINGKFDRDWHSLNPQGKPDDGALMTLETLFGAFNTLGISGPTSFTAFIDQNVALCTGPATTICNGIKVNLTNATRSQTLFGVSATFTYDLVVWMDTGSGYSRFIEGSLTPGSNGDSGKGNVYFTSCSGCTPVGHAQIEWDTTSPTYHLKTRMWQTKMGMSSNGNVVLDATYIKSSGDMKLAASATNACGTVTNDSNCATNNTTGYTAIVHANMSSGISYIQGLNKVNSDTTVLDGSTDALCIDASSNNTPSACSGAGLNTLAGITPIPVNTSFSLGTWTNANWPFVDITDTPNF